MATDTAHRQNTRAHRQNTRELRQVRSLVDRESAIQEQINEIQELINEWARNEWARGVRYAWELHLQSVRPTMERWTAVWASERSRHKGLKLPAGVREAIVQELVTDGMSTRAVAVALGISVDTANRDARGTERNRSVGADGRSINTENIGKAGKSQNRSDTPAMDWNPGNWDDERINESDRLVRINRNMWANLHGIDELGNEGAMLVRVGQTIVNFVGAENKVLGLAQIMQALSEFAASYRRVS